MVVANVRRKVLRAACLPVIENLEGRQLFSVVGPDEADFTAVASTTNPATSVVLTYSVSDSSEMQVEWKRPTDENFHTFVATSSNASIDGSGTPSDPYELTIIDLIPDSSYEFRLRTEKNGLLDYAEDEVDTEPFDLAPGILSTPTNISATQTSSPGWFYELSFTDTGWTSGDSYYLNVWQSEDDPYHLYDEEMAGFAYLNRSGTNFTGEIADSFIAGKEYTLTLFKENGTDRSGFATYMFTADTDARFNAPALEIDVAVDSPGYMEVSWDIPEDPDGDYEGAFVDTYALYPNSSTPVRIGREWIGSAFDIVESGPEGTEYFSVVSNLKTPYSNVEDGFSDGAPRSPGALTAVDTNPGGKGEVNLTWSNSPNNEDKYILEKSVDGGVTYQELEVLEPNGLEFDVNSYVDGSNQIWGQTYHYRVKARLETPGQGSGYLDSDYAYARYTAPAKYVTKSLPRINCNTCNQSIGSGGDGPVYGPSLTSNLSGLSESLAIGRTDSRTSQPFLAALNGDVEHVTIVQGDIQWFFDYDDTLDQYVEAYGGTGSFVASGGNFVFTDAFGNSVTFNGSFEKTSRASEAKMVSRKDAAGNTVQVTSQDSGGNPLVIDVLDGTSTVLERWEYAYLSSGANQGRLQSVSKKLYNGSAWATVRAQEYTYYDGTTAHGSIGDVKTIVTADGSSALNTNYYRYYVAGEQNGFAHGLKLSFGNESYQRTLAALSVSSFDSLTDSQIDDYADSYTQYDGQNRISSRTLQGEGCSTCTGGQGTYTYSYLSSSNVAGANSWSTKVTEMRPDSSQLITYYNSSDQAMLSVEKSPSGQMWGTFTLYDSDGRSILTALPSAVALPSSLTTIEAYADLLHYTSGGYQYLSDNTGVVELTEYYSSTTATTSAAGGVKGYFKESSIKKGESGTAIPQNTVTYIKRAGSDATIYPIAESTVYRSTGGSGGQTSSYSYSWIGSTVQMASEQVTLPTVTTAQNGPNLGDVSKSYFDSFGRTIWTEDASGYLTYSVYDADTGGLIKHVVDADPAAISDSPITEPSRGGGLPTALHLVSEYVVDSLGRATKATDANGNITYTVYNDAAHEVRTYRAWDATAGKPLLPIEVSRQDLAGSYAEILKYAWTGTSGNSLPLNGDGSPAGTESITSAYASLQSLSRTYTSAGGQVSETRSYFNLSGLSYSTSANLGTSGTHYYATTYDYDQRGRVKRTVAPTGTINWTLYDSQGRTASQWIGTNDTGSVNGDPTGGSTAGNNMTKVAEYEYDNGGVGDGNLTKVTQIPGGGAANRVSESYYDWRNRQIATKAAVQSSESTSDDTHFISYVDLDNLGQSTASYTYDGDNVSVTDGNSDGVPDAPASSLLRAKSTMDYDEQGRVYRSTTFGVTYTLTPTATSTVSSDGLVSNVWFDHRGNVIKSSAPGGAVTKIEYDGAGRATKSYTTDGGGDSGWSDADDVTGDKVLEQSESAYDANGNVILSTTRQAFHDNSGTGAITDPSGGTNAARVYYQAAYYDAADRLTAAVDVGTNNTGSPTPTPTVYSRPGSPASRSDDALVTSYTYDAAGMVYEVTDPKAVVTRTLYDALGRTKKTIENYVDGTPSAADDRTTEYTYDGSNHVLTMTASNYDGSASTQTTQYVYGESAETLTSLTSSGTTVTATLSGHGYKVGETVIIKDANQSAYNGTFKITAVTSTTFTYTALSTPSASPATGTVTVRRNHDIFSNDVLVATRYPDKSTGAASATEQETYTLNALGERKNKVDRAGSVHEYTYDVLGRLTADAVTTLGSGVDGSIRRLATAFNSAGQAYRFTSYTTATGSTVKNDVQREFNGFGQVTKEYQNFTGAVNTSTTEKVQYTYSTPSSTLNASRLTGIIYPTTYGMTVTYDYGTGGSLNDTISRLNALKDGSQVLEEYTYLGADTIVERKHPEASLNLTYIGSGTADAGDKYIGLDRFGRIVDQRWDNTTSATDFDDFSYTYDRNGNATSRTNSLSSTRGELYTYDNLNRLSTFKRGTISSGAISSPTRQQGWAYDALGNMTNFGEGTSSLTWAGRTHNKQNQILTISGATSNPTYDANGNTTLDSLNKPYTYDAWNRMVGGASSVPYEYDALGRAVKKWATYRYYSIDWQVLMSTGGGASTKHVQNVWSQAYIDGLVVRYRDVDLNLATNGYEEHLYVTQDANWNVTSIIDASTDATVERYQYDPYGKPTYMTAAFGSRGNGGNYEFANLLQDGAADLSTRTASFRNREYNWELMRWMQNDPAGYVDGANTFEMERSNPINWQDPFGLKVRSRLMSGSVKNSSKNATVSVKGDARVVIVEDWAWQQNGPKTNPTRIRVRNTYYLYGDDAIPGGVGSKVIWDAERSYTKPIGPGEDSRNHKNIRDADEILGVSGATLYTDDDCDCVATKFPIEIHAWQAIVKDCDDVADGVYIDFDFFTFLPF